MRCRSRAKKGGVGERDIAPHALRPLIPPAANPPIFGRPHSPRRLQWPLRMSAFTHDRVRSHRPALLQLASIEESLDEEEVAREAIL